MRKIEDAAPPGWAREPFERLVSVGSNGKIPRAIKSMYRANGRYPVVDQGQKMIAGYVDDEELIFCGRLPVVTFGDHTRSFKYVDFPFVAGADGTRILMPRSDRIDTLFFYYALCSTPLRSLGYSRHYKLLRQQLILYPRDMREQRGIARVLASIDDRIKKNIAVICQLQVVKRGLMQRLFTRDRNRRDLLSQEIDSQSTISSGQDDCTLSEYADQRTAKVIPFTVDECPYVALQHIAKGQPRILGHSWSRNAISEKTIFRKGDVLFGKLRPNLRKSALAPFDGLCSTDILPLFGKNGLASSFLLQLTHWSRFQQHAISTASGTKMPRTSWKHLREFRFSLPSLGERREIVAILSSMDSAIEQNQKVVDKLQHTKRGLAAVLLTGELRVTPEMEAL